ncbi:hypothetical protein [Actinoplanes sp. NPDC049265]|uniref:hypothetical protein n=1 Tax=Actinoplanes sp. NPDC049265 TaxID=3363902 RepID=UPI00371A0995
MTSTRAIVAAVIGPAPADPVLRAALIEADRRRLPVVVLGVGAATPSDEVALDDQVRRWAEKYPDVTVTVFIRRQLDAAVTLVAASRTAELLVADPSGGPAAAAVVRAVRHRAGCPVTVVQD